MLVIFTGCVSEKMIKTAIPAREAGQEDVLGLTCDPIDTVRIGFIGLGMRGSDAIYRYTFIDRAKIVALCDLHQERVDSAQKTLEMAGLPKAAEYSGTEEAWKQLCERDDIDLVYICTDWKRHAEMILYAMNQGKHVACEVPSATNIEEIWNIVNTAEKTRKHCIQLENCVYDFFELTTLNMAQHGLFGDILHVEGSYIHNLEPYWEEYEGDWRMIFNRNHRGDIYPTHGMGPACQLLDIHRGDKMNYLVSMDTRSASIPAYLEKERGEKVENFANGDHTMTMIKTEKGKTILIEHDVANVRPYTRMYQLTGTKGFANKYPIEGYAFEDQNVLSEAAPDYQNFSPHRYISDEAKEALMQQYRHPIQIELEEKAKEVGGHGGMDFIMDYRLIYCLTHGLPLDMDVYDLAEWCCISPLSAISMENSSAPVEIPDFTRGGWNKTQGFRHIMK